MERVLGDVGMIDLDLGRLRRATVWREGLQLARFVPVGAISQKVPVFPGLAFPGTGCACLELVIPHGAQVDYGLLGACFTPFPQHEDVVVIGEYMEGFGTGPEFDSRIAVAPESPVVGLPKELVDSVTTGAAEEIAAGWSGGPGELRFAYAAHGAYGSGARVFSQLARLVVIVLQSAFSEAQDLEKLVVTALSA